jgi:hypothetical protein
VANLRNTSRKRKVQESRFRDEMYTNKYAVRGWTVKQTSVKDIVHMHTVLPHDFGRLCLFVGTLLQYNAHLLISACARALSSFFLSFFQVFVFQVESFVHSWS